MPEAQAIHPVRAALIKTILRRPSGSGFTTEEVNVAIDAALDGRPFLDWLRSGGLEELIKLVLNILMLFKTA